MLRRSAAGLLCLVTLALAGCAPVYVHAAALPPPPVTAGTGDLRPGLLTPADLPAGFMPVGAATNANGAVSIGGGDFRGCPGLEPMTTERTTAAAVTYSRGVTGPYLTHAVVRFPPGDAAGAMEQLAGTIAACRSFTQPLAGLTVRFQITATQPPATLGDRAVGLRMTGTTDFGIAVAAEIVAVRRGDLVVWLNDTVIGTTAAGLASDLAQAAADRCAERLKGC